MEFSKLIDYKELRDLLNNGSVRFKYIKKDGTSHDAFGTRNPDLIPKAYRIHDVRDVYEKTMVYFDLEANGYRSVFIDINKIVCCLVCREG